MAALGEVLSHQKISNTEGNFTGILDSGDQFGVSVTSLGDLDSDGVTDLAVGAYDDEDGGRNQGAVWVLFLNPDGTVKSHQKISATEGGFTGILDAGDEFGISVTSLGDLDSDGVTDLAVGAWGDDDGSTVSNGSPGAVWVLFLNSDGTVKSHQKISATEGNFTGILDDFDFFGRSVATLNDFDGDEVTDLVVGATYDDDGGINQGAVWMLFLNPDGTVKSHQKISAAEGGFTGSLNHDYFGESVASLGDLDGDGVTDLVVGATDDLPGGAVWILFLNPDGTVKSHQKIDDTEGNFTGSLNLSDGFGVSVTSLGDLDSDGVTDLAVGASGDGDGIDISDCIPGRQCGPGAVWLLFLNPDGTVKSHQKISATEGNFTGMLDDLDAFGSSVDSIGDLDGDGAGDLVVGAYWDDDGAVGSLHGAVWVLFLDGGPADADGDGIGDDDDVCPDTAIPESVPTNHLGVNRWALVDDDGVFDTVSPPGGGNGPDFEFTIGDTGGCSCEQIIEAMALGWGHAKSGCSTGALLQWISTVDGK
jgi:hypothetical protein